MSANTEARVLKRLACKSGRPQSRRAWHSICRKLCIVDWLVMCASGDFGVIACGPRTHPCSMAAQAGELATVHAWGDLTRHLQTVLCLSCRHGRGAAEGDRRRAGRVGRDANPSHSGAERRQRRRRQERRGAQGPAAAAPRSALAPAAGRRACKGAGRLQCQRLQADQARSAQSAGCRVHFCQYCTPAVSGARCGTPGVRRRLRSGAGRARASGSGRNAIDPKLIGLC